MDWRPLNDLIPLSRSNLEILVKWLGYEDSTDPDEPSSSWEPWSNVRNSVAINSFLNEYLRGIELKNTLKIKN